MTYLDRGERLRLQRRMVLYILTEDTVVLEQHHLLGLSRSHRVKIPGRTNSSEILARSMPDSRTLSDDFLQAIYQPCQSAVDSGTGGIW